MPHTAHTSPRLEFQRIELTLPFPNDDEIIFDHEIWASKVRKVLGNVPAPQHPIGIRMFDRKNAYSMGGFESSGADFLPQYKPNIFNGKTVIA